MNPPMPPAEEIYRNTYTGAREEEAKARVKAHLQRLKSEVQRSFNDLSHPFEIELPEGGTLMVSIIGTDGNKYQIQISTATLMRIIKSRTAKQDDAIQVGAGDAEPEDIVITASEDDLLGR